MAYSESNKKYKASLKGVITNTLGRIKNRYKRIGKWEVDVDNEYLTSIFPEDWVCPILGYKMHVCQSGTKGGGNLSPSLDRIDPDKGYIKGNVQWVSMLANLMMTNARREDLIRFANWINKKYKQK